MTLPNEITLPSGRKIGDGHEPFIICEIGSNWRDLDECLSSIHQAKACGADAVKFQLFNLNALYGQYTDLHERISPYLDEKWLPHLKSECDRAGLEFMCSAFSPELIDAVDPYVSIHKVASAEMTHVKMLEKLAQIGKPVILSTGASGMRDIGVALNVLGHSGGGYISPPEVFPTPVILMYCIASYPAREVDLDVIPMLRSCFNVPCGYSDHTIDVLEIPRGAVRKGACVVEKHFSAIDAHTPDSDHSLNPYHFKRMVDALRGRHTSRIGYTAEENEMVLKHNRRLIATCEIREGEVFREGYNFGAYRSLCDNGRALSPFAAGRVEGKKAKKNINSGEGIGPGDF